MVIIKQLVLIIVLLVTNSSFSLLLLLKNTFRVVKLTLSSTSNDNIISDNERYEIFKKFNEIYGNNDDNSNSSINKMNSHWTLDDDQTLYNLNRNNEKIEKISQLLGHHYHHYNYQYHHHYQYHQYHLIIIIIIIIGRGIKGVEARLKKLKDPKTKAYQRLFNNNDNTNTDSDFDNDNDTNTKVSLKPANEVITRLLYDSSLDRALFSFFYEDRVLGLVRYYHYH